MFNFEIFVKPGYLVEFEISCQNSIRSALRVVLINSPVEDVQLPVNRGIWQRPSHGDKTRRCKRRHGSLPLSARRLSRSWTSRLRWRCWLLSICKEHITTIPRRSSILRRQSRYYPPLWYRVLMNSDEDVHEFETSFPAIETTVLSHAWWNVNCRMDLELGLLCNNHLCGKMNLKSSSISL